MKRIGFHQEDAAQGFLRRLHRKALLIGFRLEGWVASAFGSATGYCRFIILSRSRTGSTWLASLLDSHPGVECGGEPLGNLNGRRWQTALRSQFPSRLGHTKAIGFKLFYYHPLDAACPELWQALQQMSELRVVHLRRRNLLRAELSWHIAMRDKRWQQRTDADGLPVSERRITLDPAQLEERLARTRAWEGRAREMFAAHQSMELFYEDLVAAPGHELRRVTDHLGLPWRPLHSSLCQQNPEPLSELIENHDELVAHFADTPWAPFFVEPMGLEPE